MPPRDREGRLFNSVYLQEIIAEWAETTSATTIAPDSVFTVEPAPRQRVEQEYRRRHAGRVITDEPEDNPFRTGRPTWTTTTTPSFPIGGLYGANPPKAVAPKKEVIAKCAFPDEDEVISGTQILVPFTELYNIDGRVYSVVCHNVAIGVYSNVWVQQAQRVWHPSPVLQRQYPTYSLFANSCLAGWGNELYFSGLLTDEVMEKEKLLLVRACGHSCLTPEELKDVLLFRYVRDNKICCIAKRVHEGTKAYEHYEGVD